MRRVISQSTLGPVRPRQAWRRASDLLFPRAPDLIFLADLYPKNEKENLTHAERNKLKKIAAEIKWEFGG